MEEADGKAEAEADSARDDAGGPSSDHEGEEAADADAGGNGGCGAELAAEGIGGGKDAGGPRSGDGAPEDASSRPQGRSSKRARVVVGAIATEEIRPVSAPIPEPVLQVPEVSGADVGKLVISETSDGTMTGVVESYAETEEGLGVWTVRWVCHVPLVFATLLLLVAAQHCLQMFSRLLVGRKRGKEGVGCGRRWVPCTTVAVVVGGGGGGRVVVVVVVVVVIV